VGNYTINAQAIATNMWSPDLILGLNPTVFYALVAVIAALAVIVSLVIFVARRKRMKTQAR
jgi:hypothetical protein